MSIQAHPDEWTTPTPTVTRYEWEDPTIPLLVPNPVPFRRTALVRIQTGDGRNAIGFKVDYSDSVLKVRWTGIVCAGDFLSPAPDGPPPGPLDVSVIA